MMNETPAEPPKEPTLEPMVPAPEPHTEPSAFPEKKPLITARRFNKKAVLLIATLFIIGTVVGLILSNVFIDETNGIIDELNNQPSFPGQFNFNQPHLTADQIILPTFGVIIVCICALLLIGMIAVYIKIGLKTRSPYVLGLLVFLVPLLAQTIFSVSALRSLFLSAAIPDAYIRIRESIGFGFGGFGGVLVVISVFEIIGLTMLLYLSQE